MVTRWTAVLAVLWMAQLVACEGQERVAHETSFPSTEAREATLAVDPMAEDAAPRLVAGNRSVPGESPEMDNVHIPLRVESGAIESFLLIATHPVYLADTRPEDIISAPDWRGWRGGAGASYRFDGDGKFELYNDHDSVVIDAVREPAFWRLQAMSVSAFGGASESDVHMVRVYVRVPGTDSWNQVLVLYCDGMLRLIAHPPTGLGDVTFGSSVLVGPTSDTDEGRPVADVESVLVLPEERELQVTYRGGGKATLRIVHLSRSAIMVRVRVDYDTSNGFAAFRSMFMTEDNCDVARVRCDGRDNPVMEFAAEQPVPWRELVFHRPQYSRHNTSAPDITVRADQ